MRSEFFTTHLRAAVIVGLSVFGASSMAEMGKVMALIKPQVQGRADMGKISAKIKAALAQPPKEKQTNAPL